jgi:hypothetical protein
MILFREKPKESTKSIKTNKNSKFGGYKINIQNSVSLLYTKSKLSEKEIKKASFLFTNAIKIKYLGRILIKEVNISTIETIKY